MRPEVKLSFPSVRVSKMGICEPVIMTVLPRFSSMNDRADAVYDNVSVPCKIKKPS